MELKKHINIPIFIPHLGCQNQCVFCNQRFISGTRKFDIEKVRPLIESALSTINDETIVQIAFFGGSFTGIDRSLMIELLETAEAYIKADRASSIRLSTRPDYISDEVLDVLSRYHVSTIELGIQSICDEVLSFSKRGHTSIDVKNACKAIKERGFELVGQMMLGLPGSTIEREIETARYICSAGASAARIYPTVVFADTELATMMISNAYVPLSLDTAVARGAEVLEIFVRNNVDILRIGLCDSDALHNQNSYCAGPNHPALGELIEGMFVYKKVRRMILDRCKSTRGKNIVIYAPKGLTSKVVGNKKVYKNKLIDEFSFKNIKVLEKDELLGYNIDIAF